MKAVSKLFHETYDILHVGDAADNNLLVGASKQGQLARLQKAEEKLKVAAGSDGVFQLDEYVQFLKRNHTLLQEVFCLQRDMRRAVGGDAFWNAIVPKIAKYHTNVSFK